MTAVDKRMYYLMLSPSQGQEFAETVGFSPPSEEVEESEVYDVISRWAVLAAAGVLEDAISTAEWFLELEELLEIPEETTEDFKKVLVAHGMSLVNKLLDSEKLALISLIDGEDEDE